MQAKISKFFAKKTVETNDTQSPKKDKAITLIVSKDFSLPSPSKTKLVPIDLTEETIEEISEQQRKILKVDHQSAPKYIATSDPLSQKKHMELVRALGAIYDSDAKLTNANVATGVKYTPLEQQVVDIKKIYGDCLLMVECGYRIRFFGEDAVNAAKCLGIYAHMDHNFMVASIPTFRSLVHARRLVSNGYKVAIVRQLETAALKKASDSKNSTFKRSVVAVFSPGNEVDDDDPAFRDLIATSSKSEGGGDDGESDDGDDNIDAFVDANNDGTKQDNFYTDNWILAIHEREYDGVNAEIHCVFFNIRGHTVHMTSMFADNSRQSFLDELDILQPCEVLVNDNITSLTMEAIQSRYQQSADLQPKYVKRVQRFHSADIPTYDFSNKDDNGALKSARISEKSGRYFSGLRRINITWAIGLDRLTQSAISILAWHLFDMDMLFCLDSPSILQSEFSTQKSNSEKDCSPMRDSFQLDGITARDLQIFTSREILVFGDTRLSMSVKRGKNTLFSILDQCRTNFGKRKLKLWLMNPLVNIDMIRQRQDTVEWLVQEAQCRSQDSWLRKLGSLLEAMPDLERFLTSLHNKRISCMGLVNLLKSISKVDILRNLSQNQDCPVLLLSLLEEIEPAKTKATCSDLLRLLNAQAAEENDIVNIFTDESIQQYPRCVEYKQRVTNITQNLERKLLSIRTLLKKPNLEYKTHRVGATSKIEYLVEIPVADIKSVPSSWILVNSTKTVHRYHEPEVLRELENLMRTKDELKIVCRDAWLEFLEATIANSHGKFRLIVERLAVIDVLQSLSRVAMLPGYCKPTFDDSDEMNVHNARHPVVEYQFSTSGSDKSFIPNDILIRRNFNDRSCIFVTGPNMGGKSCYTLMVSTIALMGQIGSFVPAESAKLIPFDCILTRMGADDDIASGQSTFMIELSRVKKMLTTATPKSLIVIDELGRGTSTFDGVAIATSTAKYFIEKIGCSLLFVTHYPQVPSLAQCRSIQTKAACAHMSYVKDSQDERNITFLYKLVEGLASGSYGINVARLAGLSEDIITRASVMSDKFLRDMKLPKCLNFQ